MQVIAQVAPAINVQRPDTEPMPGVCLSPNAFVATMPFTAYDRVERPRGSVALDLTDVVLNYVWNRNSLYCVGLDATLWHGREHSETALPYR